MNCPFDILNPDGRFECSLSQKIENLISISPCPEKTIPDCVMFERVRLTPTQKEELRKVKIINILEK